MLLLIAFAFLAGIVTILSPCVLPVLPVILSGGLSGGKARPLGVITGFIASFVVFTLSLSSLVRLIGFDPDVMRWIAAILILGFGIVLVVPKLKDAFMALATRLVARRTTVPAFGARKPNNGFWPGLVLGAGLGLVWTPCVGPIMASVAALALTSAVNFSAVILTLVYALGTAIPLFLVMRGGRALLNRVPWLTRRMSGIQRGMGVLMVLTSVALVSGADRAFSRWILEVFPNYGAGLTSIEATTPVLDQLETMKNSSPDARASVAGSGQAAPDPLGTAPGVWINSSPLSLGALKGKVVLVDFWTYSCINCVRTLPYLRAWYEKYRNQGLVIVGVHSPEFAFERSESNVRRAVSELGVSWPVVQDNDLGVWKAMNVQGWPEHFLYDRNGRLIETHLGEGGYAETEAAIVGALGSSLTIDKNVEGSIAISTGVRSPETYLGYGRGQRFASPENVVKDRKSAYTVPATLEKNYWALGGEWNIQREYTEGAAGSALTLHYQGEHVYLVMGPGATGAVHAQVSLDGKPVKTITVDGERMYTLVDAPGRKSGVLSVTFDGAVKIYAFTFG